MSRFFTLLLLAAALAACAPSGGRTLYVQPAADGEWDDPAGMAMISARFTTIQDAIGAATSGDTVLIPSGTYTETVTMASGVSLVGAGRDETIILGTVWVYDAMGTSISSLSIFAPDWAAGTPSWSGYGIESDLGDLVVDDVHLAGWWNAIYCEEDDGVTVTNSKFTSNTYGVHTELTSNLLVANNLFSGNLTAGVFILDTDLASIVHNVFIGNGFSNVLGASNPAAIRIFEEGTQQVFNNILTGNVAGLNCDNCIASWGYNDIWGNVTDYIQDASADPTDLSVDPGFVNASESNFHLDGASPLIDAGTAAWSVATDFDGNARPAGAAPDIGMDEFVVSGVSLLITEVLANPDVESTGEFVEVLNTGSGPVDLADFLLTDGDRTDPLVAFGGGTTSLAPGAYGVIVDSEYAGQYAIDSTVTVVTTDDTTLGNGLTIADPITLFESDGTTIVATFSFPSDPGEGTSLELADEASGDVAGNWQASQCSAGSSAGGPACFPAAGDPAALVITEVLANADVESTGEYIELWNSGTEPVNGAGLIIDDGDSTDVLQAVDGGVSLIAPGQHALIVDPDADGTAVLPAGMVLLTTGDATIGNGLAVSDPVTLYAPDGVTVIDAFSFPSDEGNGVSIEKIDYSVGDLASNWQAADTVCMTGTSAGRLNGSAGGACGPLVINEVMANPLVEANNEYVEIWNTGLDTVDLAGLIFSDGDEDEPLVARFGGPTTVEPGGYVVIVDTNYQMINPLPADVNMLTTADASLGNSLALSDVITLYEADGVSPIDSFAYPFNPGNGVSAERIQVGSTDSAANWVASPCGSGGSIGFANCASTGAVGNTSSSFDLLITEVMSNPLVESTGEYVELYNAGSADVDLAGMTIWDGDAVDPLEGFAVATDTVLGAGEYAVILDSSYAGQYTIPAGALLLTTDDAAIASGLALDDTLTLFEPDGVTIVDTFSWPFNAGDGNSIERVDLAVGDVASNWVAGSCGPTPGATNCP